MVDGSPWPYPMGGREIVLVKKPTLESLHQVDSFLFSDLWLAIECRRHGWHELSSALYQRAVNEWLEQGERKPFDSQLRQMAWGYWTDQLTDRSRDRKTIVRYLKMLVEEDENLRSPLSGYLISGAESTLLPRRSKPGSIEALIDDLTDYWVASSERNSWVPGWTPNLEGQEAYWKLVDCGFEAVPSLIEHLNDDRFSRAMSTGAFNNFRNYNLTVGHLASKILYDLSARKIGGGYWALRGDRIDPDKAREWFAEAKKVGEEKWLTDHAVPKDEGGSIVNEHGRPENLIVRVIGVKYPQRLPTIYRAMLKKKPSGWLRDYVREIVGSKLPRQQKIELIEEGVASQDRSHRTWALEGLSELDLNLFRKHLVGALKDGLFNPYSAVDFADRANDPEVWNVLVSAMMSSDLHDRIDAIRRLGQLAPSSDHPIRRDRITVLYRFLEDRSVRLKIEDEWDAIEVRDHAATQLAGLLGFSVDRDWETGIVFHTFRGPMSQFAFRAVVAKAAEQELKRRVKP